MRGNHWTMKNINSTWYGSVYFSKCRFFFWMLMMFGVLLLWIVTLSSPESHSHSTRFATFIPVGPTSPSAMYSINILLPYALTTHTPLYRKHKLIMDQCLSDKYHGTIHFMYYLQLQEGMFSCKFHKQIYPWRYFRAKGITYHILSTGSAW